MSALPTSAATARSAGGTLRRIDAQRGDHAADQQVASAARDQQVVQPPVGEGVEANLAVDAVDVVPERLESVFGDTVVLATDQDRRCVLCAHQSSLRIRPRTCPRTQPGHAGGRVGLAGSVGPCFRALSPKPKRGAEPVRPAASASVPPGSGWRRQRCQPPDLLQRTFERSLCRGVACTGVSGMAEGVVRCSARSRGSVRWNQRRGHVAMSRQPA
jgi:hypothetical protein